MVIIVSVVAPTLIPGIITTSFLFLFFSFCFLLTALLPDIPHHFISHRKRNNIITCIITSFLVGAILRHYYNVSL